MNYKLTALALTCVASFGVAQAQSGTDLHAALTDVSTAATQQNVAFSSVAELVNGVVTAERSNAAAAAATAATEIETLQGTIATASSFAEAAIAAVNVAFAANITTIDQLPGAVSAFVTNAAILTDGIKATFGKNTDAINSIIPVQESTAAAAAAQKALDDAAAAQKVIDDAAAAQKVIDDAAAAQKVIDDAAAEAAATDTPAAPAADTSATDAPATDAPAEPAN